MSKLKLIRKAYAENYEEWWNNMDVFHYDKETSRKIILGGLIEAIHKYDYRGGKIKTAALWLIILFDTIKLSIKLIIRDR